MNKSVSASEANRSFSRILHGVREGNSYIVTSHGQPVARILPVSEVSEHNDVRAAVFARLIEHLKQQPAIDIGPWTRDELYDDE